MKKTPERMEIEIIIQSAFNGVRLGGGISLKQADAIDRRSKVTTEAFRALPRTENTRAWDELSLDDLESNNVAHLDGEGFRYYIQAFMLSVLDSYDPSSMRVRGTIGALDPEPDSWDYHMGQYQDLNPAQRVAIARFLKALPALVELDSEDVERTAHAYGNYWQQFLSPTDT